MPSQYKLTYFDAPGKAEFLRWILVLAGQDFEDCRLPGRDEWMKIKNDTPFGHIPTLEMDGKTVCQTLAIARYLASLYGLGGDNDEGELKIDSLAYSCNDLAFIISGFMFEQDPEIKASKMKKLKEEQLPRMMENWNKQLVENNGGDSWFVGNKMTWADLMWVTYVWWTEFSRVNCPPDWLKYPKLRDLRERVESHPKIAAWLATHPPPLVKN